MNTLKRCIQANGLLIAWVIALISLVGSLYLSEGRHLVPCVLCWYQRICMYPLVLILGIGILRRDKNVSWYGLPLAIIGGLTAAYHSLIQWGIIPEAYTPCQNGVSCGLVQLEYFHFLTIPFASFLAFASIAILIIFWQGLNSKLPVKTP